MTSSVPAGLRERKKAKTKAAIREAAMQLFEEQGYASTTVEQIAEAAEVSPSTFFRYFPAKEDVILTDDYDPAFIAAIRAQPPEVPTIDALLAGMRSVFDQLSPEEWELENRRQRLFGSVPELRARAMQQMMEALDLLAGVIAERAGKPADDLTSRVIAGAVMGVVMAIMPPGMTIQFQPSDFDRLEEGLTILRQSLRLD
jgi:AcrR family transcriptional regulator